MIPSEHGNLRARSASMVLAHTYSLKIADPSLPSASKLDTLEIFYFAFTPHCTLSSIESETRALLSSSGFLCVCLSAKCPTPMPAKYRSSFNDNMAEHARDELTARLKA
jgi:hypothetical protein